MILIYIVNLGYEDYKSNFIPHFHINNFFYYSRCSPLLPSTRRKRTHFWCTVTLQCNLMTTWLFRACSCIGINWQVDDSSNSNILCQTQDVWAGGCQNLKYWQYNIENKILFLWGRLTFEILLFCQVSVNCGFFLYPTQDVVLMRSMNSRMFLPFHFNEVQFKFSSVSTGCRKYTSIPGIDSYQVKRERITEKLQPVEYFNLTRDIVVPWAERKVSQFTAVLVQFL